MRVTLKIFCLLASAAVTTYSCSKNDNPAPDPCSGYNKTINFTKTESVGTSNDGTITILEPRGDTITYKLNNGAYQTSWYFTNIPPGNHVITIKNDKGCTDTAQITILNYGPKYALVKQIIGGPYVIGGYCGPCHLGVGNSGGKNFDTDASIVANWDRIKARAVDNIPSQMPEPPNAMLTPADKQKITDWVNAGHRQSD
ncbi:MAG: hypothetical protein HZB42_01070 [Sphingobacteriales bacterium]|nr:hypothetical protein [Sphingobacteriales bacterium]